MVIRASSAAEIRPLVDALSGPDDIHREAAIARLAVIGARAVERLIDAYGRTTDSQSRVAILRTLEAIGDHRAESIARQAIAEGGDASVAAAGVLRSLLTSPNTKAAGAALDTLIAAALDQSHDHRLRLAAFEALQEMPEDVRNRVADAIRGEPEARLRAIAKAAGSDAARVEAVWSDAVEGHLPDDPELLRGAVAARAAAAPLGTLQHLVDAVRAKSNGGAPGWLMVRGALHQALALRGSSVALYDLRESLETAAQPLPASFLAALHVVGDASCLEPLAAAWRDATDERWRQQLAETFHAVAGRLKSAQRKAVIKRIASKGQTP